MGDKSIDYLQLVRTATQMMEICVQASARSEALEYLLIDKGVVTKAELNAKVQECAEKAKKMTDALGTSVEHES
ncbi:MAG: hypothetical protein WA213_08780 [Terriglobales bacterium]